MTDKQTDSQPDRQRGGGGREGITAPVRLASDICTLYNVIIAHSLMNLWNFTSYASIQKILKVL